LGRFGAFSGATSDAKSPRVRAYSIISYQIVNGEGLDGGAEWIRTAGSGLFKRSGHFLSVPFFSVSAGQRRRRKRSWQRTRDFDEKPRDRQFESTLLRQRVLITRGFSIYEDFGRSILAPAGKRRSCSIRSVSVDSPRRIVLDIDDRSDTSGKTTG
jgi:hypothetical protein